LPSLLFGDPLVQARGDDRKQILRVLLEGAYAPIFRDVPVARATIGQLETAFMASYKVLGDTRRKAVAFFVHAAQYAGIVLSPHITERTKMRRVPQSAANGTTHSSARRARQLSQPPVSATPVGAVPQVTVPEDSSTTTAETVSTLVFDNGAGRATLSFTADLFLLNEDERMFLLDLIDRFRKFARSKQDGQQDRRRAGVEEE